jgi:uncharacterized membrane protein YphA (DoxX/SURF4 family)
VNSGRGRVLAVIRILIGLLFIWNGVSMLMDQDLLFGGLLRHLNSTGGPVRFYRDVILPLIERHETSFVFLSAWANIVIGVFLVTGTLISLTSLAAAFFVVNYGLASSSYNRPRMLLFSLATLLLLMLGRMGAGLAWGVDAWLIRRFKDWLILFPFRLKAPR